ncbi:MAG: NAD(P)H-dependent oxidoreductase [Duncaniella sp.]|nr:NAD(P)H-dependent oxidoreductase [Duncaniella sp.]
MKRCLLILISIYIVSVAWGRTLVVYYSFTNNVHSIIEELSRQIEADVIRIEPAQKGVDYAADYYAVGDDLIKAINADPDNESSYPDIDPVDVDLSAYDTVIIGAPLWWGQMAAPLQTFLFKYGKDMADKNIGLIVSSSSTGISGVEKDAARLIPDGRFFRNALWIRSSQVSSASSKLKDWLTDVDYTGKTSLVPIFQEAARSGHSIYTLSGVSVRSVSNLSAGIYIIDGKKVYLNK